MLSLFSTNISLDRRYTSLLFLGDSITAYWNTTGEHTWKAYYEPYSAINMGVPGIGSEELLRKIQSNWLSNVYPKAIVLLIGTNDKRLNPREVAKNIELIIKELLLDWPQSKILLLGIFPRDNFTGYLRIKNDNTNHLLAQLKKHKQVTYLNINDFFLDKDKAISIKIMPDQLHLSALGYKIWAETMNLTLLDLLKQ
jgi:beta-glucosidase